MGYISPRISREHNKYHGSLMLWLQMIHCQLICLPILKKHTLISNVGAQNPASLMKLGELNQPFSQPYLDPRKSTMLIFPTFHLNIPAKCLHQNSPKKNLRKHPENRLCRGWLVGLGGPNDQSNSRRIPGAAHLNEGSIRRFRMKDSQGGPPYIGEFIHSRTWAWWFI